METSYYEVEGEKIPLFLNQNKVNILAHENMVLFEGEAWKLRLEDLFPPNSLEIKELFRSQDFLVNISGDFNSEELEKLKSKVTYRDCYMGEDGHDFILTDEIIIKINNKLDLGTLENFLSNYSCNILRKMDELENVYILKTLETTPSASLMIANQLNKERNYIEYSEPNFLQIAESQFDPLFPEQWYLSNEKNKSNINIEEAWQLAKYGNSNVVITIHDQEIDIFHEEFKFKIEAGGFDYDTYDNNPAELNLWHGTACAGIAVGSLDGRGVVGVAPNCKILPIKLRHYRKQPELTAKSLLYAAKKSQVLSCSWALPFQSNLINDALKVISENFRHNLGVSCVFAAGNYKNNKIAYPANHPSVIAVGACDMYGKHASYSCTGDELFIVAPSSSTLEEGNIVTTDPSGRRGLNISDYMNNFGGTSAAVPQVAGSIALLLSINPNLSVNQIKEILSASADKIDYESGTYNESGWSNKYGFGKLNAGIAARMALATIA